MLEKTLESPLGCKEIKPVNPKGNQPEYSLETVIFKLKLQYSGHLMPRADSLKSKTLMLGRIEGKRRSGQQRMKWLDSITESMDINLNKFWESVENRGAWHVTVHEVAKSGTWLTSHNAIKEYSPITFLPHLPRSSSPQSTTFNSFIVSLGIYSNTASWGEGLWSQAASVYMKTRESS